MHTNILGWQPRRWDQIPGNAALKRFYQRLLVQVRKDGMRKAVRLFVPGPSRSGKTACTRLFAASLMCLRPNPATLDPCGECRTCKARAELAGYRGLEVTLAEGKAHFLPLDATKIEGPDELQSLLAELQEYDGVRLVWIDEAHRLKSRKLDEQLLKPVEEKAFIWIMTSAYPEQLEVMFTNRFVKVPTEPPALEDLVVWLADRCDEFGIAFDDAALVELAGRVECIPGVALQALEYVSATGDRLTVPLVVQQQFAFDW